MVMITTFTLHYESNKSNYYDGTTLGIKKNRRCYLTLEQDKYILIERIIC